MNTLAQALKRAAGQSPVAPVDDSVVSLRQEQSPRDIRSIPVMGGSLTADPTGRVLHAGNLTNLKEIIMPDGFEKSLGLLEAGQMVRINRVTLVFKNGACTLDQMDFRFAPEKVTSNGETALPRAGIQLFERPEPAKRPAAAQVGSPLRFDLAT